MRTASELLAEAHLKRGLAKQFAEFAKAISPVRDRERLIQHAAQLEGDALRLELETAVLQARGER